MGEEIKEKEKANSREIDKKNLNKTVNIQSDACQTPPAPEAEPVPMPYPNTAMASDTSSGSKTVKTEGKMLSVKDDFGESVGDEAGTSNDESEPGNLTEILKIKILGVPLWIWGLIVVAVLVVLWILSSNSLQPIKPLE